MGVVLLAVDVPQHLRHSIASQHTAVSQHNPDSEAEAGCEAGLKDHKHVASNMGNSALHVNGRCLQHHVPFLFWYQTIKQLSNKPIIVR